MDRTPNMPMWVFLGLANINTRKGALILFLTCLSISIATLPLAYLKLWEWLDWSWPALMFPCSLWYWLCIRWVDKHQAWA